MSWNLFKPKPKGFGYNADPKESRDKLSGLLGLSASFIPDRFSLEKLINRLHNQEQTNSCTGHAIAAGIHIALAYRKIEHAYPSARFLYYTGRAYSYDEDYDDGAHLRYVLKAVQKIGYAAERDMIWSASKINAPPAGLAYLRAHSHRGVHGYFRILEPSVEKTFEVAKRAVHSGLPVVFGMNVDKAFTAHDGPSVIGKQGAKYGGHALLMVGFDKDKARVLNSWGDWRDGGLCWMDEGARQGWRDVWIIDPVGGPHA